MEVSHSENFLAQHLSKELPRLKNNPNLEEPPMKSFSSYLGYPKKQIDSCCSIFDMLIDTYCLWSNNDGQH